MQVYFKDVERDANSVKNSTSIDGRSITSEYSFSPRISSKSVKWWRPITQAYAEVMYSDKIPEGIKTIIWTDRSPLFYFGYNTTIWTIHEYRLENKLYDLRKPMPNKRNIHMLLEPSDGCGEIYNFHKFNPEFNSKFDVVLSHNREFCSLIKNSKWYPWGTTLLDSVEYFNIYKKLKIVSFNYSFKTWWPGHKFRHTIGNLLKQHNDFKFVDITGPIELNDYIPKLKLLKDYFYSIQIENQKVDDFFSDKIIDCFLTGTIPIYYGTNNICNYFNKDGIIQFDTYEQLLDILSSITPEMYYKKMDAIVENFNLAQKYISPDDWIFNNYGSEVLI